MAKTPWGLTFRCPALLPKFVEFQFLMLRRLTLVIVAGKMTCRCSNNLTNMGGQMWVATHISGMVTKLPTCNTSNNAQQPTRRGYIFVCPRMLQYVAQVNVY